MNLKKTASTFADNSCDENLLIEYAEKYKDEIRSQIELTDADIAVCCGWSVFDILDKHFILQKLNNNSFVYKSRCFKSTLFLPACHPSSRKWKNNLGQVRTKTVDRYDDLVSEFQEYLTHHTPIV